MIIEMPCITCPLSCRLLVTIENEEVVNVSGNSCPRGCEYAKKEISHPVRVFTSTLRIKGALHPLLPVISSKPVPKERMFDIIQACETICVKAPVQYNEVVIKNVLKLGVDICASRSMNEVKKNEAADTACNQ